jgi:hypothetical protein
VEAQEAGGVIMSNRRLFTAIPNAVIEAYSAAEITPCMFIVLCLLYKQADWATGRVAWTCANILASRMQGQYSPRTIQEAIHNLHAAGWIVSHHKKGSRRNYRVDLGNFTALTGALKGQVLNPCDVGDWRDPALVARAEDVNITSTETSNRNWDEKSSGTATHQSIQNPQESIKSHNSPKSQDSLSLPSSLIDEEPPQESNTEETNLAEETLNTLLTKLGVPRRPTHFPLVQQSLAAANGDALVLAQHMLGFADWMIERFPLKVCSIKDFFFHWNNESGNEDGFRLQYNAVSRALKKQEEDNRSSFDFRCRAPGCNRPWVEEKEELKLCAVCAAAYPRYADHIWTLTGHDLEPGTCCENETGEDVINVVEEI